MMETQKSSLNKRALVSLFMLFSFILLPLSGIPLHFVGTGVNAGKLEHFLMSVHNLSALIFLVAVVFHLGLNWSVLKKYLTGKIGERFQYGKELTIALTAIVFLVGLFSSHALHGR